MWLGATFEACRQLVGALMAILLVTGLLNILGREIGGAGLIWYNDVARYLLVWVTLIGAGVLTFRREHIAISDAVTERFPARVQTVVAAIRLAAAALFAAVVLVEGLRLTIQVAGQGFVTLRWLSVGFAYAALPTGAALILLAVIRETILLVRSAR